jgi:dephospho-CoA kinase
MTVDEALDLPRVAIVGGPRTGKTTLSGRVTDREVLHTDTFRELPQDQQSSAVIAALAGRDRFVVEGVLAARALRKGLEVDVVIYCETERAEVSNRQRGMAKAVRTVMRDWWQAQKATGRTVPIVGF